MDTNKDKAGNTANDKTTKTGTAASTVSGKSLANSSAESASDNDNNNMKKETSSTAKKTGSDQSSDSDRESNTASQSQKPSETEKDGPLFKFFTDSLKDIYFAEKHILEALPKMQKAATTSELQEAFEDHYLQTQKQVSRLEKVFKLIGEEAEGKKCEAIIGIVKEGETCIKDTEEGSMTRDAGLIIAAQKVEHYEIASYGGLAALAETLGLYDASDLLHTTLEEEEQTDIDLTDIAESFINFAAKQDDEDDDDYDDEDYEDEDYDEEDGYENHGYNRGRTSYR
ncbi:Domain of uncharacterised function (DUF892) [Chryseobacterium taklimakanense]|uniref:Domain of uncharacterized function (DUF892) n=1 Tax=Chryseobacterium taklimakanense TaxID=536441 RepID=A0A239WQA4_9FLAO|nr:ferritin-like domain-containing protein [Chryseobacterium taklimakanense]SNV36617.1 Domain of uncharacterised function (DUF892) [Chryseobacterium taklimakanense]